MPKKFRVAVLGAGAIGQHHIAGFQLSPYAEVVAVGESNLTRAEEAAQKFSVPDVHQDYREILARKDIQVVSIALPNYLHARVAIEALKAGKHVMLDKPIATNARDAAKIIAAAKKARKVFMVGQNMRFSAEVHTIRKMVKKGALGSVHHARAYWWRRAGIPRIGSWFTQKKFAGGGACYDIGVHLLDLVLYLLDDFQVASVSGAVSGHIGRRHWGEGGWGKSEIDPRKIFDVDDRALALLKMKNGATIYLEVAWASFQEQDDVHGIDLFGDKAGVHWPPAKIFMPAKDGFVVEQLKPITPPWPIERMVHFMECVALGKKPLVPPQESYKVQKVLDAIYRSSQTGREVRLATNP